MTEVGGVSVGSNAAGSCVDSEAVDAVRVPLFADGIKSFISLKRNHLRTEGYFGVSACFGNVCVM